ncbi:MAG: NAD-dependent DNA ligase LigA [Nitrosarchaeum sp.]|nr:NAD-dependent DNA ligase LigA [Nitrosarchaeum sp.]
MKKPTEEIKRLESDIRLHRYLYYNKASRISDQAFDGLMARLKQIAPDSEVLNETGAPRDKKSGWQEATHTSKVASLNNSMSIEDFEAWVYSTRVHGKEFVLEDKLDGLTLVEDYVVGNLVQAITRGDGKVGDNILINALKMQYVKPVLKEKITCRIRSEIMLFKKDFETINKLTGENYANPRNAAGGICKRFDGKLCEYLRIISYDIVSPDITFTHETEKMDFLSNGLDIVTANYKLVTPAEVLKIRQEYVTSKREALPYLIDGLVIKLNSIQKAKDLGQHPNGDPKGHTAFKFDAKGVATTLNDIDWTVGRSGVLTPNAVIEPVNIDGSMVKAASICNIDEIERLGIGIGDQILVVKSGEIIPKIIEVIKSAGKTAKIPTVCPACKGPVIRDGAFLKCTSDDCVGKDFRKLRHWVDVMKKRMSLEDIGESTIMQLFEKEKIKDPADFYKLSINDISSLDRSGTKSATKIVEGFNKCKELDVVTFLTALGIPSLGQTMAEVITEEYDLYALMEEVTETDLAKISGIGPNRAKEILDGLEQKRGLIEKLLEVGVKVKKVEKQTTLISSKLQGKSFMVTGGFTKINPASGKSYTREEWYEYVQSHGGTISRVNKDLNYLVCMKSMSNKIKKAQALGVKIIGEDDFWTMVE